MGWISESFVKLFNDNIILATIIISTLPVVELRGAIPFATNSKLWGATALSNWQAFGWSLLGSSLIVPILALIFLPIINWLKQTKFFGKFAEAFENHIKNKAANISNNDLKVVNSKNNLKFTRAYWKKCLAVFLFVAIPLPLTGVWTGTCVAMFLGLDYITTCASVISGNIVAGLIIALILKFLPWLNDWLLWIFLAVVVVVLIYEIISYFIKQNKEKTQ